MRFDDILRHLGEFGPYQKRLYFILCIPMMSSGFHAVISVFLTGTPDHRCAIPGYDNDTYAIQSDYHSYLINLTIPPNPEDEEKEYAQCEMYNVNISDSGTYHNRAKVKCTKWVYDRSIFLSTFTDKVNLVCDDRLKTTHVQMIYFAGVLVGSIGLGLLSDAIGRKKVFFLSILLMLVSTMALPWSPDFVTFCILRFITGMSGIGLFMTGFVIGMELVGPSKRVITGVVIEYFWCTGVVILAGVAYGLRDWFYIEIATAVPTFLYLSYWWLIPESARWLVSRGKYKEARKIIDKAAKVNKVELSKDVLDFQSIENPPREGVWQLFTTPRMFIRTSIIFFNWLVVSMVFYGLALNSGNLGGDFYLNFFLQGLVEYPAYTLCLVLLNRTGRRVLHCSTMIIGGLCCICTIFTMLYADQSLQPVTITLAMLGKLGITAAFAVIYVWSAELYPTVVRNASMGLSSTFARVGGMVSPYIADISKLIPGNFGRALPLAIFGGASVIAGVLAIFLPETMNMNLPETMEDGRQFGKNSTKYEKDIKPEIEGNGGVNPAYKPEVETNGCFNPAYIPETDLNGKVNLSHKGEIDQNCDMNYAFTTKL